MLLKAPARRSNRQHLREEKAGPADRTYAGPEGQLTQAKMAKRVGFR
jgi:hypothetical protein